MLPYLMNKYNIALLNHNNYFHYMLYIMNLYYVLLIYLRPA